MLVQINTPFTMVDALSLDKPIVMTSSMAKKHINIGIDRGAYFLPVHYPDVFSTGAPGIFLRDRAFARCGTRPQD